jgi:asparagine synthase (glutamine-hydrolysing)
MCGIFGLIKQDGSIRESDVVSLRDTMSSRGPDSAGVWVSPESNVAFAHRRLAIVDLSELGHQPMSSGQGRYWITYNGEIYNYRQLKHELRGLGVSFRTGSDTEVVLEGYRLWGNRVVDRLDGMFAFVIYDKLENKCFGARDRAGEKPFYYALNATAFVFSSNLTAILRSGLLSEKRINGSSLNSYLAFGYSPAAATLVNGVTKLEAGHSFELDLTMLKLKTTRYWELPSYSSSTSLTFSDTVERFRDLLYASVKNQIVADVDVGVLLSGGIDSSLIAAIASQQTTTSVKTYNVSFGSDPKLDESQHARSVAKHIGSDHTELSVNNVSPEILFGLNDWLDEPIADHAILPTYLLAQAVSKEMKVVLGGDGSDELFAGYKHYEWLEKQYWYRNRLPKPFHRIANHLMEAVIPIGTRGRNPLLGIGSRVGPAGAVNMYFDPYWRRRLQPQLMSDRYAPERTKREIFESQDQPRWGALRSDFKTTLQNLYLVKTDRACMAHSLELRSPFLSKDLIEFAYSSVKPEFLFSKDGRKLIPKALGRHLLPRDYDFNRKQGFTLPLAKWYRDQWGETFKSILLDDASLFPKGEIERLFYLQSRGYDNMHRLFLLAILEIWRQEHSISG